MYNDSNGFCMRSKTATLSQPTAQRGESFPRTRISSTMTCRDLCSHETCLDDTFGRKALKRCLAPTTPHPIKTSFHAQISPSSSPPISPHTMGQKNSAPGSERRNSRSIPPGGFSMPQPNIPPRTRRTTVSGTPAPHRQSSVNANNGTGSIGSHRRTASAAAGNRQAAYRANNIPSPPPYSPPPFAPRIPQTIPEPQIRRNNVANPGEENALDLLK